MNFSNYARIGRSPLIKAIGLQKNRKETYYTESQQLDRHATGCFSCPNFHYVQFMDFMPSSIQEKTCNRCKQCPNAVYKTIYEEHTRYINEKNQYGNAPRLKGIALKLLVTYHFLNPDNNGTIKGISPSKVAKFLGCSVRSILNSNKKLQEYGYILFCHNGAARKEFNVILPEYKTYGLTAREGGRGYATFNMDFLKEIVKIKDINQLRIFLRLSLDLDTERKQHKKAETTVSYNKLQSFLPDYCKRNVIQKALSAASSIFSISCKEDQISLQMNDIYHGRKNYEANLTKNVDLITEYIRKIDSVIKKVNQDIMKKKSPKEKDLEQLSSIGVTSRVGNGDKKIYKLFNFTTKDYSDLGLLCMTYSYEKVIAQLGYLYENYLCKFRETSPGALIRTILNSNLELLNTI